MLNLVAFMNAIIIASSVLSSVYSFPTLELGTGLDTILPLAQSTCFEARPYPNNRELKTLNGYAVDSEGRSCSENLGDLDFRKLLNKTTFETSYPNETAKFCPSWYHFKQCLSKHVNSNKCSTDEKAVVHDSVEVNIGVAIAEQLCSPSRAPQFQSLVKHLLNEDLLDCLLGHKLSELLGGCVEKMYEKNGHRTRFQDLDIFFYCMRPVVRYCANGDHVKEETLVRLWVELDRAIQDGHVNFWN